MYMEAIAILIMIHMQGFPPPPKPVPIFTSGIGETLMVSCPRTRCDASTLETKTELLDVKSSAQPLATMPG